jgi:hypothetical protein
MASIEVKKFESPDERRPFDLPGEPFSISAEGERERAGCVGDRGLPGVESEQWEIDGSETGACPVCGGRFHLDQSGRIPQHTIPAPLHGYVGGLSPGSRLDG